MEAAGRWPLPTVALAPDLGAIESVRWHESPGLVELEIVIRRQDMVTAGELVAALMIDGAAADPPGWRAEQRDGVTTVWMLRA